PPSSTATRCASCATGSWWPGGASTRSWPPSPTSPSRRPSRVWGTRGPDRPPSRGGPMAELPRLPLLEGRPARVVSLVYNDASADSRVQKTAATLRAAGADAVVVAISREVAGHPPGPGTLGDGLPVHRVHDL